MISGCCSTCSSGNFFINVSADEGIRAMQPPDLRHVTVLRKTEWLRIQDELCGVNKEEKRIREAAKQRENLHLQSQEVVKLWPDTLHVSSMLRDIS